MIHAPPMKKGRSGLSARPLSIFQFALHSDSNDIIDDNDGINDTDIVNDSSYLQYCVPHFKAAVDPYTDQGRSHGHQNRH